MRDKTHSSRRGQMRDKTHSSRRGQMRDKTHVEQIERWAKYVRDNPDKWKGKVKPFIDAQILMARRFYKDLAETEEGRKKIEQLFLLKKNIIN